MSWDSLEPALPFLAFLAGLLVCCTLTTLAAQRRNAIDIYERIRASKSLRAKYLEGLKNRVNSY